MVVAGAATLCFWVYQIYLEFVQLLNGRPMCRNFFEQAKGYFTQGYNFNDLMHLLLTAVFVITNFFED